MNKKRRRQIEEEIKRIIGNALIFESKDPRLPVIISITAVDMDGDMKQAKVYISTIDDDNKEQTIDILNKASGFFRRAIGKELKTYHTPKPIFIYDYSIEKSMKMGKLIEEINSEN